MTYIAPKFESKKFTCSNCQAIAHKTWEYEAISDNGHIRKHSTLKPHEKKYGLYGRMLRNGLYRIVT